MNEPSGERSRRLGRGLGALISSAPTLPTASAPASQAVDREIPLDLIQPNPRQPRRDFRAGELGELEESMRTNGLLQPVAVRPRGDGSYELIAGERRLRAAKRLGWAAIPAVVREITDEQLLTMALVENLQREDLNPLEEAEGYRRLTVEFGLSQQRVAEAIGKDRSTIANMLRLLALPDEVQQMLRDGQLTVGHARALLGLPPAISVVEIARHVVREQLTVRDVEKLAQAQKAPARVSPERTDDVPVDPEARRIGDRLRRYLQTDVEIVANKQARGELRIRFYSADDLERILELIAGPSTDAY